MAENAKTFSAVCQLTGFNGMPTIKTAAEITKLVEENGYIEIHRGITSEGVLPPKLFAEGFLKGEFFPGNKIAYGHGAYFATPSLSLTVAQCTNFSNKFSKTAAKYSQSGDSGLMIRCAMPPDVKIIDLDEAKECRREFKNRAAEVGIKELGTFCASMGFDAIKIDDDINGFGEITYNVVNRSILLGQTIVLIPQRL